MYRAHLNALNSGSVLIFSHAPMPCFCTAARNAVSSSACQYPRNVPVGESEVVAFFPPFIPTTCGGDGDGGVEAVPALFSPFFSVVIFVVVAAALFALTCFANLSFIFLFFHNKSTLSLSLSEFRHVSCVCPRDDINCVKLFLLNDNHTTDTHRHTHKQRRDSSFVCVCLTRTCVFLTRKKYKKGGKNLSKVHPKTHQKKTDTTHTKRNSFE